MKVALKAHEVDAIVSAGPDLLVGVNMTYSQMLDAMRQISRHVDGSTWAHWMDTLDEEAGMRTRQQEIDAAVREWSAA